MAKSYGGKKTAMTPKPPKKAPKKGGRKSPFKK